MKILTPLLLKSMIAVVSLALLTARPAGAQALFQEDFEGASSIAASGLPDSYHDGGLPGNIVLSTDNPHSGSHCLRWTGMKYGPYYVRGNHWLSSQTGRVSVSFWVNMDRADMYWWRFQLPAPGWQKNWVDLFTGVGYSGNNYGIQWGVLRAANPNGTWRSLCGLKTGWRQMKIIADFSTGTADIYYDDMKIPIVTDFPMPAPDPGQKPSFVPSFGGVTGDRKKESFSIDDIVIQDLPPPAPGRKQVMGRPAPFPLAHGHGPVQPYISNETGALSGAVFHGQSLVNGTNDTYTLLGEPNELFAKEEDDVVQKSQNTANHLVLTCINPNLPGVTLQKTYFFAPNGDLVKRIKCVSTGPQGFLTITSRVILDPVFQKASLPGGFSGAETLPPGEHTDAVNTSSMIRKDFSAGVAEIRTQINGRYVWPSSAIADAQGWESQLVTDYLRPGKTVSCDRNYFFFRGDWTDYQRHIAAAPEYLAMFPQSTVPWKDTLLADAMYLRSGMEPFHKQAAPLPVSSTIWFLNPPWGNWRSDSDPPKSVQPGLDNLTTGFRHDVPNAIISAYTNMLFDQKSDVYKLHPKFGVYDKDGQIIDSGIPSDAGDVPAYWLQILDPAARSYFLDMSADRVKNWKLDFFYMDGPGAYHETPDWKRHVVPQFYDWLSYFHDLKTRLKQISPDTGYWTNGVLPYSDIGYIEWPDTDWQGVIQGPRWPLLARSLLTTKLNEPPGYLVVPLYVRPGTLPGSLTYDLVYGWCGQAQDMKTEFLPFYAASLEERGMKLSPSAVSPRWWREGGDMEAYGFTKGRSVIVNVVSHGQGWLRTSVTLDTRQLGLMPGQTYLARTLTMNAPTIPETTRAYTPVSMTRVTCSGPTLKLNVPVHLGLVTTVILSQAMAYAEDNGARKSETGLVETYAGGLTLTGRQPGQYHWVTKYGGESVFFPYAAQVTSAMPSVTAEKAVVDGVAGVRVTAKDPGTFRLTLP